jgi:hypothetical protein
MTLAGCDPVVDARGWQLRADTIQGINKNP